MRRTLTPRFRPLTPIHPREISNHLYNIARNKRIDRQREISSFEPFSARLQQAGGGGDRQNTPSAHETYMLTRQRTGKLRREKAWTPCKYVIMYWVGVHSEAYGPLHCERRGRGMRGYRQCARGWRCARGAKA